MFSNGSPPGPGFLQLQPLLIPPPCNGKLVLRQQANPKPTSHCSSLPALAIACPFSLSATCSPYTTYKFSFYLMLQLKFGFTTQIPPSLIVPQTTSHASLGPYLKNPRQHDSKIKIQKDSIFSCGC